DDGTQAKTGSSANAPPRTSALTEQVLAYARELAGEQSADHTIAGEHLLLALLSKDEALRSRLERLGLRFADLESQVLADAFPPLRLDEPLSFAEPAEEIDTARILDASANRAREALRVMEDYCRFCLDDRFLSTQLKELRHDLAEALATLPPGW